jgi:hypothetical protein
MAPPPHPAPLPDRTASPPAAALASLARVMDEFIERYVRWREAANAAREAYEHWTGVAREGRPAAFANYRAALDGEEAVADAYRASAERIAGHGW